MPSLPIAILAGGLATRLRPVTERIPKALIPILGRPFLAHQIELLRGHGITHLVLCVGYLGEMIEREFGDGRDWGVKIEYSYDGPTLVGTAGALRRALPKLGRSFYVLYGDSYLEIDYQGIAGVFVESGKKGLMTVFANEGKWDTSNVHYEGGQLMAHSKKNRTAAMRHIDYGLSILKTEVIEGLKEGESADLSEVLTPLIAAGQIAGYEVFNRFYEVGSQAGISELERHLRERAFSH